MSNEKHDNPIRIRRRRLGLYNGPRGEIYVGDPDGRPAKVHVFSREAFVHAVKAGHIRARHWVVGLSREDCLVKEIGLPASDESEARQILAYELPGLVPVQAEPLCHSLMRTGPAEADLVRYAVFLSPQSRVEKATAPLTDSGVVPGCIIPDSIGLWQWFNEVGQPAEANTAAMLVAMDAYVCQVIHVKNSCWQNARSLPFLDRESGKSALRAEVGRFRESADVSTVNANVPRRLFWAGRPELLAEVSKEFAEQSNCACGLHLELPQIHVHPGGLPEISEVAALCALGCALENPASLGGRLNMLPVAWQEQRRRREQWMQRAITAGAVAVVPALAWCWLALQIERLDGRRIMLEQQIAPIKDVAGALERKKEESKLIDSQISDRAFPLEVLAELHKRVPEGLSLSQLEMDLDPLDPKIRIKGSASTLESAFAFPSVLEQSSLFADVRPDGAQQVSRGQSVLIEFNCRSRIDRSAGLLR